MKQAPQARRPLFLISLVLISILALAPASALATHKGVHIGKPEKVSGGSGDPIPTPEPDPTPAPEPIPEPGDDSDGDYWVSPSGSDSNPGTAAAPWRTLTKAIAVARGGDTVIVRAGSYGAQRTTTTFGYSGTASAPITFRGAASEARPQILGHVRVNGNYVQLRHLLFDGPTGQVLTPTTSNPLGEEVQVAIYGDGVVISGSEVRDSLWHAGIYLSTAYDARLTRNYIHDNGNFNRTEQANLDHGIYFGSGSGLVANNVVEHNLCHGVQLYTSPQNVTVTHNTIVRNGKAGVIIARYAAQNTVVNNVIAYNGDTGIRSHDLTGTGNVARNNVVYGNGGGNLGLQATGISLIDNILSDPRFIAMGDWRLTSTSPAIDRGLTSWTVADDYLGIARPLGLAPDIGAYESH